MPTLYMDFPFIICHDYKIWSWSITRWRVTIFSAEIIFHSVIDIVISIYNKSGCSFPNLPTSICYCSCKHLAAFINTYVIRPWILSLIDWSQKILNICWRFWSCKLCPGNNNTTRCPNSLNTIKSSSPEVVYRWWWICIWIIILLWIWPSASGLPRIILIRSL